MEGPSKDSDPVAAQPATQSIGKPWVWLAIVGVAVILAAFLWIVYRPDSGTRPVVDESAPRSAIDHSPGSEVTIYVQGRNSLTVAVDEKAFDEMVDAISARGDRLDKLLQSGRVFTVANKTRARIIEASHSKLKVRIIEGEKVMQEVWVPEPWVR